jgi:formate hydrogenlyase transcriptional activator
MAARPSIALIDIERDHIRAVLERVKWRVRGAAGAAELLGMKPSTLESRMAKLGIERPQS